MFGRKKRKRRKEFDIPKKELERLYYDLGWTLAQIGDHYGCDKSTVRQRMKEYGLLRRISQDYVRIEIPCAELRELYVAQGWTQVQIGAHYGCSKTTVSQRMRDCGIPPRSGGPPRQVHVPPEVLAAWPSASLAYAVGVIAADGNLSKGNHVVRLSSTDFELTQHYRACLRLSSAVETRKQLPKHASHNPLYWVAFTDHAYRAFLERLGLTPAKSLALGPLDIPDTVFPDFVRGYWDGDGGWYLKQGPQQRYPGLLAQATCSSPAFFEWLQARIEQQTGLHGGLAGKQLYYYGAKAVTLGLWMYYAPELPSLTRKRAVWEQFT